MTRTKRMGHWVAITLIGFAGAASAASVPPPVLTTLTFDTVNTSGNGGTIYGKANIAPAPGGSRCPGISDCHREGGFMVGTSEDTANPGAHVHSDGVPANRLVRFKSDTGGFYVRRQDGTPFSLISMSFRAPIDPSANPGNGPLDNWEFLGFNTAFNPGLDSGDGTNHPNRVAYQKIANGFEGTLTLDPAFHLISAFWVHYEGYPRTPGVPQDPEVGNLPELPGKAYLAVIDNIQLGAPVPLPAAAWIFASGLTGLALVGRRRSALAAPDA
jgi:hypothetical protein